MENKLTALECLNHLKPAALEYDEWLAVGMACKDAGISFAEWDNWSAQDSKRYRQCEMKRKWDSFQGGGIGTVGVGTIVKLCKDQGYTIKHDEGHELEWDAVIGGKHVEEGCIVAQEWIQEEPVPALYADITGKSDLIEYLKAVFDTEDRVGYVVECYASEDRMLPKRGVWDRTAGELIEAANNSPDLGAVIGDWNPAVGGWIRFNPLDGEGCSDRNVTTYRHALVESDDISIERQYAIYKELELPIAALVHSGGKSLHAIVKIEAPDFKEYQKRVDFLYEICKKNGLSIDRKNRNPSRLSRLPGVTRNNHKQYLVAVNIGKQSWTDWADWIAAQNDDLPDVESLADYIDNPPELTGTLIKGILRQGHKMLLSGPSKAGKSFLMLQLAIAIAEGNNWLGWECAQGRVLYVNLELDRASCYHRLKLVYETLKLPTANAGNIDIWNLRGKAMPMTELAPRLIRRALKKRYTAILIDPIYKVITGDENAADQMAKFCNQFDRVCNELGVAVIYCHHHSKGGQGQKRASDRASGSGVFARDPDALLDCIELEITDAIRDQYVNRRECEAIADALDKAKPNWRDDCPQDDQIVAKHLADWCEKAGLGDVMRSVRPQAREKAFMATGWRVEGILREFAAFKEKRMWFDYPVHNLDNEELLTDALAEGEEPPRQQRQAAIQEKREELISEIETAYESLKSYSESGIVTVIEIAEHCGITADSVRNRIKKSSKNTTLRFKKGVVYKEGQNEPKH